jgi:hypothetical protein
MKSNEGKNKKLGRSDNNIALFSVAGSEKMIFDWCLLWSLASSRQAERFGESS